MTIAPILQEVQNRLTRAQQTNSTMKRVKGAVNIYNNLQQI